MLVALVVRMHGDGRVAEHRLRARRRDDDVSAGRPLDLRRPTIGYLKCQRLPFVFDLLDLEVGDRRQQFRVPIDEALVLVDQPFA